MVSISLLATVRNEERPPRLLGGCLRDTEEMSNIKAARDYLKITNYITELNKNNYLQQSYSSFYGVFTNSQLMQVPACLYSIHYA